MRNSEDFMRLVDMERLRSRIIVSFYCFDAIKLSPNCVTIKITHKLFHREIFLRIVSGLLVIQIHEAVFEWRICPKGQFHCEVIQAVIGHFLRAMVIQAVIGHFFESLRAEFFVWNAAKLFVFF